MEKAEAQLECFQSETLHIGFVWRHERTEIREDFGFESSCECRTFAHLLRSFF